uniref:HECT domain-containing protein n=2 Tax=Eutreptiella gymnastica TaxID=73025 RepID=A0A7S1NCD2_9EUGL|mmetsp:Transcript_153946/g.269346  ORF Transcript_153946/g.269346 Transcript_153946/m.269346 type:complete len:270 (+) Transcript_153946:151-960(+)
MYRFLGSLFGLCVHTWERLPLRLPPLFWKRLVGAAVGEADLAAVDAAKLKCLRDMRAMGPEDFNFCFEDTFFVVEDDRGTQTELVPGGAHIPLTWSNREEYAQRLQEHLLGTGRAQIEAVRQGLVAVVPETALDFLTWQDLEYKVCGLPEVAVDCLKASTSYEGELTETHPLMDMFWSVVGGMSSADRSRLLRFITGRSRLPVQIRIERSYGNSGNEDDYLPTSHTCGNSLDLPSYSSAEVMRRKLLYAIYNCSAIDTDNDNVEDFVED